MRKLLYTTAFLGCGALMAFSAPAQACVGAEGLSSKDVSSVRGASMQLSQMGSGYNNATSYTRPKSDRGGSWRRSRLNHRR